MEIQSESPKLSPREVTSSPPLPNFPQMGTEGSLKDTRVFIFRDLDFQSLSMLKRLTKLKNLAILDLEGNLFNTTKILNTLQMFRNLRKLDLSGNNIVSLPSGKVFSRMNSLQLLYLHNNQISVWQSLASLTVLGKVLHITLFGNAVVSIPGYRHYLVNSMPNLIALDFHVVTDEERFEDACYIFRFRAMNEYMKIPISDPQIFYGQAPLPPGVKMPVESGHGETQMAKLLSDPPEHLEEKLFQLDLDIYRLRRHYEHNSPSILIQKMVRGTITRTRLRNYVQLRNTSASKLQRCLRGWVVRRRLATALPRLRGYHRLYRGKYRLMSDLETTAYRAKLFIVDKLEEIWDRHKAQSFIMATVRRIQTWFRMTRMISKSYIQAFQLYEYPYFYILKEQKNLLTNIISHSSERLKLILLSPKQDNTSAPALRDLAANRKYETIRFPEVSDLQYSPFPIVQFGQIYKGAKIKFRKLSLLQQGISESKESITARFSNTPYSNCNFNLLGNYVKVTEGMKRALVAEVRDKEKERFFDPYDDLLLFTPNDMDVLQELLQVILAYNREASAQGSEVMYPIFEPMLQRVAAVTHLQLGIAAHQERIQSKVPFLFSLYLHRAIRKIQGHWKYYKLKTRTLALTQISRYIAGINDRTLYLEESFYLELRNIMHKMRNKRAKFLGQNGRFAVISGVLCYNTPDNSTSNRFSDEPFPKWFGLNIRGVPSEIPLEFINDIISLFHRGAISPPELLNLNTIIDYRKKALDVQSHLKFIKISLNSVEEAKHRACALAMLTYHMTQKTFIRLFTKQLLEEPFSFAQIKSSWEAFNISNKIITESGCEFRTAEALTPVTAQEHTGYLLTLPDKANVLQTMPAHMDLDTIKLRPVGQGKELGSKVAQGIYGSHAYSEVYTNALDLGDFSKHSVQTNIFQNEALWQQGKLVLDIKHLFSEAKSSFCIKKNAEVQNKRFKKQKRQQFLRQRAKHIKVQAEDDKQERDDAQKQHIEEKRSVIIDLQSKEKTVKEQQKMWYDTQLNAFQKIVLEEKEAIKQILHRNKNQTERENMAKKNNNLREIEVREQKREDRDFCVNFWQHKNLINKQLKISDIERVKSAELRERNKRVIELKLAAKRGEAKKYAILKSKMGQSYDEKRLEREQLPKIGEVVGQNNIKYGIYLQEKPTGGTWQGQGYGGQSPGKQNRRAPTGEPKRQTSTSNPNNQASTLGGAPDSYFHGAESRLAGDHMISQGSGGSMGSRSSMLPGKGEEVQITRGRKVDESTSMITHKHPLHSMNPILSMNMNNMTNMSNMSNMGNMGNINNPPIPFHGKLLGSGGQGQGHGQGAIIPHPPHNKSKEGGVLGNIPHMNPMAGLRGIGGMGMKGMQGGTSFRRGKRTTQKAKFREEMFPILPVGNMLPYTQGIGPSASFSDSQSIDSIRFTPIIPQPKGYN